MGAGDCPCWVSWLSIGAVDRQLCQLRVLSGGLPLVGPPYSPNRRDSSTYQTVTQVSTALLHVLRVLNPLLVLRWPRYKVLDGSEVKP